MQKTILRTKKSNEQIRKVNYKNKATRLISINN